MITAAWVRRAAAPLACAATLAACGADDKSGSSGDVMFDNGVTNEPCPEAKNPGNGCIYLGTISDLSEGPFAVVGVEYTAAQKDFWDRVNEDGGIGGFDVDVVKYTRDAKYNPEEHVAKLREIEPHVLALAQSFGTPTTLAGLDIMKRANLVGNGATAWSGWAFEDDGLVLESGQSYCVESLNGLDHIAEEFGEPKRVLAVHFAGDFGGDAAAGAELWGARNDVEVTTLETAPNAVAGSQDAVLAAIRRRQPEVVLVATGPAELGEIVGKAVAAGFEGQFVGSSATYGPSLLKTPAGPALKARYRYVGPHAPYARADTGAHRAMQRARADKLPQSAAYAGGWIASYPLRRLLEQAAKKGDLTRANVRATVQDVTVDYEGALPPRRFGRGGATIERQAVIATLDDEAPLSTRIIKDVFVGSTAKDVTIDRACTADR